MRMQILLQRYVLCRMFVDRTASKNYPMVSPQIAFSHIM